MRRRLFSLLFAALALVTMVVPGYLLAAWIGSSVPLNEGRIAPKQGVEIMVETNGTHTGIVMPVVSEAIDWRTVFPSAAERTPGGELPTHVAIGYGEREVFLNVPTWSDLSPGTALRIATVGGEAVIRVSHYVRPAPSENHRPVTISREEYTRLVAAILAHLPEAGPGQRPAMRGTFALDAYYEARGRYTMGNTCNSWVGARLAEAGLPMGRWTPLAGGVMKWVPEPAPRETG